MDIVLTDETENITEYEVIGIRFKDGGKIYYFDPCGIEVNIGDNLIVETARGLEYGGVAVANKVVPESEVVLPLRPVIRIATADDDAKNEENKKKEREAFSVCLGKIADHGLEMKLVEAEYTFDNSKLLFYFTADGRVDFRELVKDLAGVFRTRIELRQIGVRDEAKMLGGLGSCGRPVCCKAFLSDFAPVSIKMAKEQSLSLSPTKISGICGRLMCCLKYEQDSYETMRKQMPRPGRDVRTPDGDGTVLENNVITEKTRVRVSLADGTFDVRDYPFRELVPLNSKHPEFIENTEQDIDDDSDVLVDEDAVVIAEESFVITDEDAANERKRRRKPQQGNGAGQDHDTQEAPKKETPSRRSRRRRPPRKQAPCENGKQE